jgi:hypothetical protein
MAAAVPTEIVMETVVPLARPTSSPWPGQTYEENSMSPPAQSRPILSAPFTINALRNFMLPLFFCVTYYICVVITFGGQSKPQTWFTALLVSSIVGTVLNLNSLDPDKTFVKSWATSKFQIIRAYCVPFCVSSLSGLASSIGANCNDVTHQFCLIFPKQGSVLGYALGVPAFVCVALYVVRHVLQQCCGSFCAVDKCGAPATIHCDKCNELCLKCARRIHAVLRGAGHWQAPEVAVHACACDGTTPVHVYCDECETVAGHDGTLPATTASTEKKMRTYLCLPCDKLVHRVTAYKNHKRKEAVRQK